MKNRPDPEPFDFQSPAGETGNRGLVIGLVAGGAALLALLACSAGAMAVLLAVFDHARSAAPPSAAPSPATAEKPIAISVVALFDKFKANLPAAETAYNGKLLRVSGIVGRVQKDAIGRYYLSGPDCRVVLASRDSEVRYGTIEDIGRDAAEAAANTRYVSGVTLFITADALGQFAGLDAAKAVEVQGRCRGSRTAPDADPALMVTLDECTLVR